MLVGKLFLRDLRQTEIKEPQVNSSSTSFIRSLRGKKAASLLSSTAVFPLLPPPFRAVEFTAFSRRWLTQTCVRHEGGFTVHWLVAFHWVRLEQWGWDINHSRSYVSTISRKRGKALSSRLCASCIPATRETRVIISICAV